jgi:hypothetical protein
MLNQPTETNSPNLEIRLEEEVGEGEGEGEGERRKEKGEGERIGRTKCISHIYQHWCQQ